MAMEKKVFNWYLYNEDMLGNGLGSDYGWNFPLIYENQL